jgi:hypothetical protein
MCNKPDVSDVGKLGCSKSEKRVVINDSKNVTILVDCPHYKLLNKLLCFSPLDQEKAMERYVQYMTPDKIDERHRRIEEGRRSVLERLQHTGTKRTPANYPRRLPI